MADDERDDQLDGGDVSEQPSAATSDADDDGQAPLGGGNGPGSGGGVSEGPMGLRGTEIFPPSYGGGDGPGQGGGVSERADGFGGL